MAHRNGPVEDGGGLVVLRVVAEGDQVVVPGEDLRPIGRRRRRRVGVERGDRGLDLVAPRAFLGERALQDGDALGDLDAVPQRAILLVERDEPPGVVGARREPGVLEQHQREQATRLGLGRGEGELAGEPDGLAGQVVAAAVTGVIDERQDAQHDREVTQLAKVAATQVCAWRG